MIGIHFNSGLLTQTVFLSPEPGPARPIPYIPASLPLPPPILIPLNQVC